MYFSLLDKRECQRKMPVTYALLPRVSVLPKAEEEQPKTIHEKLHGATWSAHLLQVI